MRALFYQSDTASFYRLRNHLSDTFRNTAFVKLYWPHQKTSAGSMFIKSCQRAQSCCVNINFLHDFCMTRRSCFWQDSCKRVNCLCFLSKFMQGLFFPQPGCCELFFLGIFLLFWAHFLRKIIIHSTLCVLLCLHDHCLENSEISNVIFLKKINANLPKNVTKKVKVLTAN